MDLHQEFADLCRKNGWKNTPQRFAVYRCIHADFTHPGVDRVWDGVRSTLPAISRESVYRILNEFAAQGILTRLDELSSARYDRETKPHGHFFCCKCGVIRDFPLPQELPYPPGVEPEELSHVELRLVGICEKCRAAGEFEDRSVR